MTGSTQPPCGPGPARPSRWWRNSAIARGIFDRSRPDAGKTSPALRTLRPETAPPSRPGPDLDDPTQCDLGDYRLVSMIGRGGMGMVYKARQLSLQRDVAIKLLDTGIWASPELIAGLYREARHAARLQHPNIVAVYGIGESRGQAWFAMQYIEGCTLAEQIDRDGPLPPADAARMILTVAEAVHYAHRLDILHLDLKPGNLLIDADGQPHITDFGLARRVDNTDGVENDCISGTPGYMAPEQVQIGPRLSRTTDVWGLGAILYESLTGRPPFEGDDTKEIIRNVAQAAVRRPRGQRPLPPDLEAIVMRCLRRRPDQRYRTARALAHDLSRFLEGHPVSARPLNVIQRVMQWALREKWLASATGVAIAAMLAGIVATSIQWRRAEEQATLASEVNSFLNEDVLASIDPYIEPGTEPARITVMAMLENAEARLDGQRVHSPAARAQIGLTLGRAYFGLGLWGTARTRLEKALSDARLSLGNEADLTLDIEQQLARTATFDSQYTRAEELYRHLLEARRKHSGWNSPITLQARRDHVQLLYETGMIDLALTELESARLAAVTHAPDQVAAIDWKLSDLYTEINRWEHAETLARRALAASRDELGPYHLQYLWESVSLADILLLRGKWDEAETRFRTIHDDLTRIVGPRHPMTLTMAHYLGQISLERGDSDSALTQLRHVLHERIEVHGEAHKWTHYTMNRLGQALVASQRPDEAIELLEHTLRLASDAGHRNQAHVLLVQDNLASAHIMKGELDRAETHLEEALSNASRTLPANNFRRAMLERTMGSLREKQSRPEQAEVHYRYAADVFSEGFGEDHPWVVDLRTRLH
ncbi:serine/threonine-protein kinase [Marilutibacter alkalisoli]|uniref:Tetratricopeptide repeat protein n=1 Tax=Marilutibacter alkalisoli TaxID=2591633 RepID=A0A514BPE0_9GAMM|nr:tetratricopeptide repeat protein [Lysobacter alkalisoli]QDH69256.1 tetratricopeptide repeat protein [Lysobacter alkalisoli]